MFLKKIKGDEELRDVIVQLNKDNPHYFFVTELIKTVLNFKYIGWEFYVFVDRTDSRNNGGGDGDTDCPYHGVLCAEHCPPLSKYIVSSKQISDEMASELKRHINWTRGNLFIYVSSEFRPLLEKMSDAAIVREHPCFTYVLRNFRKLPDIPESNIGKDAHGEFEIRQIREEFASIINSNWDNKFEHSELLIKEELTHGYGYGVFVDGNIVSWIMMRKFASMGILFVVPEYRRRGYASFVVSALSRDMHTRGMTPFVNVETHNVASARFFEKLGFERGPDASFVMY